MKSKYSKYIPILLIVFLTFIAGCTDDDNSTGYTTPTGRDPDNTPVVAVDRFSDEAAELMKRSENPDLPGANEPIDFDLGAPFITEGLGPDGEEIQYYNFDVQSTTPAPIYVFFHEGASMPVANQLNVIDVIPGDPGYNDFWQVHMVTVPDDYVVNSVTNLADIVNNGYPIQETTTIVNCPVVPDGSTASLRYGGGSSALARGWYQDLVVKYFSFEEYELVVTSGGMVPLSDILVSFNINPDISGGGPPSGFKTESGSNQTHNVVQTLPNGGGYSPLWDVDVYDNADFGMVHNWQTATEATLLDEGVVKVNCPVVSIGGRHMVDPSTAPIVEVDRFSDEAAELMKRSENPDLPGPNEPIDFDSGAPFITRGLGPAGGSIQYYNFDVQSTIPAPIYVLVRSGESNPVEEQLNIIGVLPGDAGYNDFWNVNMVTVPADYMANTITSVDQIMAEGYSIETTDAIVNCPVVPDGSTASLRGGGEPNVLHSGWYDGYVVKYFTFEEDEITVTGGMVPLADILVCFNINPEEPGGGPPSGFVTESGSDQTHNVVMVIPGQTGYSPLWDVDVYDNMDFDMVTDWASATMATLLASSVVQVNCPVVDFD